MTITLLGDWLRDPDTTASEKALYAAVALTFFCLSLGTAPSVIAGALTAGIWLFAGIAQIIFQLPDKTNQHRGFGPDSSTLSAYLIVGILMMLSPIVRDRLATIIKQFNHHLYADDDSARGNKYFADEERLYLWNGAVRIIRKKSVVWRGYRRIPNRTQKYGQQSQRAVDGPSP